MPTVPRVTKCAMLGCKETKAKLSRYCTGHGGKDTYTAPKTQERKAFNNAYNDLSWKRIRIAQLSRQPICQACLLLGRVTPANQVDHLFPWTQFGKESFWQNVFQSLCAECHSHKGALEDRGIFRHYKGTQAVDYASQDYQRVVGELASAVA